MEESVKLKFFYHVPFIRTLDVLTHEFNARPSYARVK